MDKVAKNQGLFISKPRNAKAAGRVRSNTSPTVKSMSMAAPRRFAWFDALVIWGPRYSVLGNTAVTNWNTFYILSIGIHFFLGGDKSLIAGHGLSHQLQRILQGNPDPELVSHAKNNYQCFFVSSCLLILKEQVSDFVFAYWDCKHDICHKLYVKGS